MPMRRNWPAAVLAVAIAAVSCSSTPQQAAPTSSPPPRASDRPSATGEPAGDEGDGAAVAEVLRFSAPRLGGGTIEGEDHAGEDVAFWFWAPW